MVISLIIYMMRYGPFPIRVLIAGMCAPVVVENVTFAVRKDIAAVQLNWT